MKKGLRLVATGLMIASGISCASNKTPSSPTPSGTGVAAAPAARPATPPATSPATVPPASPPAVNGPPNGGQPGGPPGGGRGRVQLTPEQNAARRDSLAKIRTDVIADLMTRIAGSETKRSADEFTNVTLLKEVPAGQLLKTMDEYGRALSVSCEFCHVGGGKWDDDSKESKKTARVMIQLVDMINTKGLSSLGGQRPPKISCVTCHRGRTGPGTALLP